jgi:2-dehydropantoate 2-reductase
MAVGEPRDSFASTAIVGGGAMGTVFAWALTQGGSRVTIVDAAPRLVERVNADGLRLTDPAGNEHRFRVSATTAPGGEPVDAALFAVKSQHTRPAARLVRPIVGDATVLITLQNGWGNADVLREEFPDNPLLIGVAYSSATVLGPAEVHLTNQSPTVVGADRSVDRPLADEFAEIFRTVGLDCVVSDNARTEVWSKLVLNAAILPPSALTGLPMGELGAATGIPDVLTALASEAVAAGRAAGMSVELAEREREIMRVLTSAGPGKASMLQDIEAGRPTEIDAINGAVVHVANLHGISAPVNAAMVALVHARSGRASPPNA